MPTDPFEQGSVKHPSHPGLHGKHPAHSSPSPLLQDFRASLLSIIPAEFPPPWKRELCLQQHPPSEQNTGVSGHPGKFLTFSWQTLGHLYPVLEAALSHTWCVSKRSYHPCSFAGRKSFSAGWSLGPLALNIAGRCGTLGALSAHPSPPTCSTGAASSTKKSSIAAAAHVCARNRGEGRGWGWRGILETGTT